ncbi:MAG: hypothetical protein ACI8XO_002418 [Verrucomicrobiales bacterium]|jgi:hypothetical protein
MKLTGRTILALVIGVIAGYFGGTKLIWKDEGLVVQREAEAAEELELVRTPRARRLLKSVTDPWRTLAELERNVERSVWHLHRNEYRALFRAWAKRDLEGAVRSLGNVHIDCRHDATSAILDEAFEQDPERAAEIMMEHRSGGLPKWLMEHPAEACRLVPKVVAAQDGADHFSFPSEWAKTDPAAAYEWASSLTGWRRRHMLDELIAAWPAEDLEGAMTKFSELGAANWGERKEFAEGIAIQLGNTDPVGALDWLARSGIDKSDQRSARSRIVNDWSRRDHEAAIDWVRGLPMPEKKQELREVGFQWAQTDVETAAEFYLSVGPANQSDDTAASAIGSNYIKEDPAAALDWVDQLPAQNRASVEKEMFRTLLRQDREVALAEFALRVRRLSVPTVERFSADFFKEDTPAAAAWLETLPRGLAYESARGGVGIALKERSSEALAEVARSLGL